MNSQFVPAHVFPPGEFIRQELEERGWSQADLAAILGRPVQVVNEIIAAKKAITPETATALAAAFGTSPELFLRLENAYRLARTKTETGPVARRANLYAKVPVRDLLKRGWIAASSDLDVLEQRVCGFLGIRTLDEEPALSFAARKGDSYGGVLPGQLAWFCRCRHLARRRKPRGPYREALLRRAVPNLPKEFADETTLVRLPETLSRLGVVLVLLEHLPGTKIDGAAFWLEKHPVVALSVRFDRVDSFWFTLMHELAHVLLHGPSHSGIDIDLVGPSSEEEKDKPASEQEADEQACGWLVPPDELEPFIKETRPYYSHHSIVAFAEGIGVNPGLVVGQLQHRGEIPWGHSRKFLVKVRHFLPMES